MTAESMPITSSEHRTQQRSGRTRLALLAAAREVFSREGFQKAEIGQITRAAGRATGTFYVHFDNKVELLKAMVEQFRLDMIAGGLDRPEHAADAVRDVLRPLWDAHERHAPTFRALAEAASTHPEMAALYAGLRDNARRDFQSMLRSAPHFAAASDGRIAVMASALEILVTSCLHQWHALSQRPPDYTEEAGFECVLEIMMSVLDRRGA
jgi:AcrR family transcriptional regulator